MKNVINFSVNIITVIIINHKVAIGFEIIIAKLRGKPAFCRFFADIITLNYALLSCFFVSQNGNRFKTFILRTRLKKLGCVKNAQKS